MRHRQLPEQIYGRANLIEAPTVAARSLAGRLLGWLAWLAWLGALVRWCVGGAQQERRQVVGPTKATQPEATRGWLGGRGCPGGPLGATGGGSARAIRDWRTRHILWGASIRALVGHATAFQLGALILVQRPRRPSGPLGGGGGGWRHLAGGPKRAPHAIRSSRISSCFFKLIELLRLALFYSIAPNQFASLS